MKKSEKLLKRVKELLIDMEQHLIENRDFEIRAIVFSLRGTGIGREVQTMMRQQAREQHHKSLEENKPVENNDEPVNDPVAQYQSKAVLKSMSLRQLKQIARDVFNMPGKEINRKKKDDLIELILDKQSELDTES